MYYAILYFIFLNNLFHWLQYTDNWKDDLLFISANKTFLQFDVVLHQVIIWWTYMVYIRDRVILICDVKSNNRSLCRIISIWPCIQNIHLMFRQCILICKIKAIHLLLHPTSLQVFFLSTLQNGKWGHWTCLRNQPTYIFAEICGRYCRQHCSILNLFP